MAGVVTLDGSGTVGAVAPGWSATEEATPHSIGNLAGSVGSLTVETVATPESVYAGDNGLEFAAEPGTWQGRVYSTSVTADKCRLGAVGALGFLNAVRTAPPSGNFLRFANSFGTTGSGDGQFDGPVALAFNSGGDMFVADNGNSRVQKFTPDGDGGWTYVAQVGGTGSGNGEFGADGPTGIAIDSNDNVWVSDWGNGRIQKFDSDLAFLYAGTSMSYVNPRGLTIDASDNVYVVDFGAGGSGIEVRDSSGTYVDDFTTSPNSAGMIGVAISPTNGDIYITFGDYAGGPRVERYTTAGVSTGFATVGTAAGAGDGEFGASGAGAIAIDATGTVYVVDPANGRIQRFDEELNYLSSITPLGGTLGDPASGLNQWGMDINPDGDLYVPDWYEDQVTRVTGLGPAIKSLSQAYASYIALCDPDGAYAISYDSASDPIVAYPGWTDNVWAKLKELCAATGTEIYYTGGVIHVADIGTRTLDITNRGVPTITPSTLATARAVPVVAQRAEVGNGLTFYDAAADQAAYAVAVGEATTVTIATPHSIVSVNTPVAVNSDPGPGEYVVVDANGGAVAALSWAAAGGRVIAAAGENPGTINISIIAPPDVIGGYSAAPYTVTELSVTGAGAAVSATVIQIATGADDGSTAVETAETIDIPFINTIEEAYDLGAWAAVARLFDSVLTVRIALDPTIDFGGYAGRIVTYDNAKYRVMSATVDATGVDLTCAWYTTVGDLDTTYDDAGFDVGDVDTLWDGYVTRDVALRPLKTA